MDPRCFNTHTHYLNHTYFQNVPTIFLYESVIDNKEILAFEHGRERLFYFLGKN